jgi:hypothetical protein
MTQRNVVSQRQKLFSSLAECWQNPATTRKELTERPPAWRKSRTGVCTYVCIKQISRSEKKNMRTINHIDATGKPLRALLVVSTPSRQGPVVLGDTAPEGPDADNGQQREEGFE